MTDRERVMKALKCRVTDPVVECGTRSGKERKMPNKRKTIPHMCITCQHYEPYHCNLNDGYIGYLDCDQITKCRVWRLSDDYKKGGKFYGMEEPVKVDSDE